MKVLIIIGYHQKDSFNHQGIVKTLVEELSSVRKDFEIIDEYVQTLRNNIEFASNFSKIKYVGHSKVNVRGQDIVRFEIEASSKKSTKKNFS